MINWWHPHSDYEPFLGLIIIAFPGLLLIKCQRVSPDFGIINQALDLEGLKSFCASLITLKNDFRFNSGCRQLLVILNIKVNLELSISAFDLHKQQLDFYLESQFSESKTKKSFPGIFLSQQIGDCANEI